MDRRSFFWVMGSVIAALFFRCKAQSHDESMLDQSVADDDLHVETFVVTGLHDNWGVVWEILADGSVVDYRPYGQLPADWNEQWKANNA